MSLQKTIENEKRLYEKEQLELNPSFASTQPELLKTLDYYYSSKFVNGDYDSKGDKKPFINKLDTPSIVASKQTDIDVKNIHFISDKGNSYREVWLMEKQFKIWVKNNKFSKFLNDLVWNLPRYGTVLAKKVGNTITNINLRNIILDPTVSGTNKPIIEKHRMSKAEFEQEAKDKGWKNYKDILDNEDNFVEVWERYGDIEDSDDNTAVLAVETNKSGGIKVTELATMKLDLPYKSHNMEDVYGRWLGRGIGEKLLETQIAANETEYYFRTGLKWTSLRAFQSRDNTLAKNVLNAVENGDILQVMSEIQPIASEERNLSAFGYSDQKWDIHSRNRSFSSDIVAGQRPAAGVPYSTSALQSQMAGNYFGFIQENLAIFLKDIIKEWIIPQFKKERNKELIFDEMSSDDLQSLKKLLANREYRNRRIKHIAKTGQIPTLMEENALKDIANAIASNKKSIEIPNGVYDNLSYKMTIDITGEMIDTQAKIATAQMLIGILGSNPQVMSDPRTSRAINKILDWAGINPTGLMDTGELQQGNTIPLNRGGSLAAPKIGQGLTASTTTI